MAVMEIWALEVVVPEAMAQAMVLMALLEVMEVMVAQVELAAPVEESSSLQHIHSIFLRNPVCLPMVKMAHWDKMPAWVAMAVMVDWVAEDVQLAVAEVVVTVGLEEMAADLAGSGKGRRG